MLKVPQQLFGRPNRDKYHRIQVKDTPEKSRKKAKTSKTTTPAKRGGANTPIVLDDVSQGGSWPSGLVPGLIATGGAILSMFGGE